MTFPNIDTVGTQYPVSDFERGFRYGEMCARLDRLEEEINRLHNAKETDTSQVAEAVAIAVDAATDAHDAADDARNAASDAPVLAEVAATEVAEVVAAEVSEEVTEDHLENDAVPEPVIIEPAPDEAPAVESEHHTEPERRRSHGVYGRR